MQFPTTRWTELANELGARFAERAAKRTRSSQKTMPS